MPKRKIAALEKVDADLPNLQHKIRRDPLSYKADFQSQYTQYAAFREIFERSPTSLPDDSIISLRDLIDFISHVAECFPDITANFSDELADLLTKHHEQLEPELREKLVGGLVLLRKKDLIDSPRLLNILFPILVSTPSKALRTTLFQKVLSDLRSSNAKATNHKLNRTLQTVLHNLLTSDRASPKGIWAVRLTRELWRRQVWTDSKAVEVMKEAALSDNSKVIVGGVNFFLGGDKEREEAAEFDSDEDEALDMGKLRHVAGINKKTKKRERELKAAAATVKRQARKKNKPHPLNFSALHLLHDPQGFAETLFARHLQSTKSKLNLEQKLQVLQLVSRLVGLHKLTIVSLYSYFIKYLTPRQISVTSFLASLAQATHNLVPPDALEPLVVKIANEFVSEAAASQVAAAGLNAIREICARQPMAMNETLLQDLVMYRKSKDKGVMMAAKGLLSLYRDVGAEMLKKRDRGRDAAMGLRTGTKLEQRFGEVETGEIEGIELLEKWKEEERQKKKVANGVTGDDESGDDVVDLEADEAEDWRNWNVEEDESDDSGGWINVESDGEDINISDSEDDEPPAKKSKTEEDTVTESAIKLDDDAGKSVNGDIHIPEGTEPQKAIDKISKLATTRILTPADLAKLNELRNQAAVSKQLPSHRRRQQQAQIERHIDDPLTAAEIESAARLGLKKTKEDKIAAAKGDREEQHKGATARRKEKKQEEGKSTTNKEKARKKNFLMTLGKAKMKGKRSLRDTSRILKGHVDRQKRGGRRGNK